MKVLIYGSTLLILAFLLHVIVWKIHLPKRQRKAILHLFFGTLVIGIIILRITPSISIFGVTVPTTILEYLHICLFFISITLAYVITYTAVEADSPSLVIILKIAQKGSKGLVKQEIEQDLNDDILVKPRINDLLKDKMAYLDKNKYKLTRKGILIACLFNFYSKVLNMTHEGG